MAEKSVQVGSAVGLHARPAAIIAEAAEEFSETITLILGGGDAEDTADAASSLMIMALGAQHGDEITVKSSNERAVDVISTLVAANLDAE